MIFTESIRDNLRFRYLYNHGKSTHDDSLVLFVKKNNLSINRLGICVSKKIGNSCARNRVTRVIKEIYRLNEKYFCRGFDMVFVAKKNIVNSDFYAIRDCIIRLSRKHNIFGAV